MNFEREFFLNSFAEAKLGTRSLAFSHPPGGKRSSSSTGRLLAQSPVPTFGIFWKLQHRRTCPEQTAVEIWSQYFLREDQAQRDVY